MAAMLAALNSNEVEIATVRILFMVISSLSQEHVVGSHSDIRMRKRTGCREIKIFILSNGIGLAAHRGAQNTFLEKNLR
jgi:hypothetical protein